MAQAGPDDDPREPPELLVDFAGEAELVLATAAMDGNTTTGAILVGGTTIAGTVIAGATIIGAALVGTGAGAEVKGQKTT